MKLLSNKNFIYFDNNASTKTDNRVIEAMLPFFSSYYANPSSHHFFGNTVNRSVENARKELSELLGAESTEIIFTSGATEAINLALKGIAENYAFKGRHIITTQTEHSAVLDVCKYLEERGIDVDYLPVDQTGLIDLIQLEKLIRKDTILVSIIYVNNETGVIQPIEEIANICKSKNILFFTDATQAVGKIPIDVSKSNIDLMSFSGHKFYGPKGIGGLYCKKNVKLKTLLHGGGHENGRRSGTLNVPGIIGLSKAFEIAYDEMQTNQKIVRSLRDEFERRLLSKYNVKINGHFENRLYNVSNLYITDVDSLLIDNFLDNVNFSHGSACNSSSIKPSHVLKAMELSDKEALSSFRFSFGKYNTMEEVNQVISNIDKLFESNKILNKA